MKSGNKLISIGVLTALSISQAHAAGLAVSEQGVNVLGRAFAGEAAYVEDASIAFHNPAGMQYLKGENTSFALHVLNAGVDFDDSASTATDGDGNQDESASGTSIIPAFFYVKELDNGNHFGLSIYTPYGLGGVEYDDDWAGRYHSIKSGLKTINVSPAASMKVGDKTSLGIMLDVQLGDARLERAVDFDSICAVSTSCTSNGQSDVEITGTGIAYGATVGLIHELRPQTTLGLTFRSQTSLKLDGDVSYSNNPTSTVAFTDGAANASLTLPDTLNLSIAHTLPNKVVILGDIKYTQWNDLDEVVIDFEDDSTPSSSLAFNYQDTIRYSIGAVYPMDSSTTLRAGIAIDPTPVSDPEDRNAANPDNDRTWLTVGASFEVNKNVSVDVAYAHLNIPEGDTENVDSVGIYTLDGSFSNSADIISAQFNMKF